MSRRKYLLMLTGMMAALILALALLPGSVSAGTDTEGPYTLTWPDYTGGNPLISCQPWNDPTGNTLTVSGLDGVNVGVLAIFLDPTWRPDQGGSPVISTSNQQFSEASGDLTVPIPYPADVNSWPVLPSGVRAINVVVAAVIFTESGPVSLNSTQWRVVCPDGCGLGFWGQEQHFDSWVGYSTADDFETVFGVDASFDPHTLLDAVGLKGGQENALARQAVAALLNASNPDIAYTYTTGDVLAMVQDAYAAGDFGGTNDLLERANESFCPLD